MTSDRLSAWLNKNAARTYLARPSRLDRLWPGMCRWSPDRIIRFCEPEITATNKPVTYCGARLAARYMRRFGDPLDFPIALLTPELPGRFQTMEAAE